MTKLIVMELNTPFLFTLYRNFQHNKPATTLIPIQMLRRNLDKIKTNDGSIPLDWNLIHISLENVSDVFRWQSS